MICAASGSIVTITLLIPLFFKSIFLLLYTYTDKVYGKTERSRNLDPKNTNLDDALNQKDHTNNFLARTQ